MNRGTTVLFGLPGVRVDRVSMDSNGVRLVEFFTDDDRARSHGTRRGFVTDRTCPRSSGQFGRGGGNPA